MKVVWCGNVVEIYKFEKMPLTANGRVSSSDEYEPIEAREKNMKASRQQFRRLANANFNSGSRFITCTFADGAISDVTDISLANKEWDKFVKRLRRKFGDFRWMVGTEFQDKNGRGAVHFHMIADFPYVSVEELESIWGNGFVWINKIDHVDNVGAYISKYMVKNASDPRLMGRKAWRTSQNMERPVVYRGDDARDFLEAYAVEEHSLVYANSYESEYHGQICYSEFNLMR